MSVTLYVPQENGSLKYIAEVEGAEDGPLALDALLDEMPRLKHDQYVAISGTLEDGTVEVLTVPDDDAPLQPRRAILRSRQAAAPKPASSRRKRAAVEVEEDEDEAPKPARKRSSSKKTTRKPPAKKAPTKPKGSTRKPPSKPVGKKASGKRSPFTKNAASEE
jgi:hypothetical protein